MHYYQRNSPPYGNHRGEQQRGYGGAGQPDYSLGEPDPYTSSYGDEDDGWRENFAQRDLDNYRRDTRREQLSPERGNANERSRYERSNYLDDSQRHGDDNHRRSQEMTWRDAPDEWDRFARQQRGSAYEFYSGRRGSRDFRSALRAPMGTDSRQRRGDLSNFPDFNPPDSHYVYPGASRAWEGQSYRGYPYSSQDFERAWQHHPSHDQNEYAQRYELGRDSGGYGLSRHHMHDNDRYYAADNPRDFSGRGPKGYERSDERVREEICERLSHDRYIDASEISVAVKGGVVTLDGSVDDRNQKHRAEDIADSCSGVKDVQNRINVSHRNKWEVSQPQRDYENSSRQQREAGVANSGGTTDDKTATPQEKPNITRQ